MKVIISTESGFCSKTITNVYVPKDGGINATDNQIIKTMRKLYRSDLDFYGDKVDDSGFDKEQLFAFVYAGYDSVTYEVVEIKSV